jgi:hypothetical protein
MARRQWTAKTAATILPWIVVAAYLADRVFSTDWLTGGVGAICFVVLLWSFHRDNQRKEREIPPTWAPGKPPNPN